MVMGRKDAKNSELGQQVEDGAGLMKKIPFF